jgi:hypothetical protein
LFEQPFDQLDALGARVAFQAIEQIVGHVHLVNV